MTVASEPDRCPPSEVLAAFVDGRLVDGRLATLKAHLATCAECRFVVESANEARLEETVALPENDAVETDNVTPFVNTVEAHKEKDTRRATQLQWWLSAAAVVAIVIAVGSHEHTTREERRRNAAAQQLANTLDAGHRLFEPRLTAMSIYAPPKPVYRGGNSEEATQEELIIQGNAAKVVEQTGDDRSPGATHLRGVANLVMGDERSAVADLHSVTSQQPADAKAWSDYSAVLFVAHQYPEAHAAAEQALALNPDLNEARFNRALAIEALKPAESQKEWNDYLKHDPASPWAKEVRERHLDHP